MESGKKEVKKTNKKQFDEMMKEMEAHSDIARGIFKFGSSRVQVDIFWEGLTKSLNNLGPPLRNTKEWRKVWADLKRNTKQKLSHNKKEKKATGGGDNTEIELTPTEKIIDEILSLTDAATPDGEVFGISETTPIPSTSQQTPQREQAIVINEEEPPIKRKRLLKKRSSNDERLKFLKTQSETQSKIYATGKKIENSLYEIKKSVKELVDVQKEKLILLKQISDTKKAKLNLGYEKLELKKKELELKELQTQVRN